MSKLATPVRLLVVFNPVLRVRDDAIGLDAFDNGLHQLKPQVWVFARQVPAWLPSHGTARRSAARVGGRASDVQGKDASITSGTTKKKT